MNYQKLVYTTSGQVRVWHQDTSLIVVLPPGYASLSTGRIGGGYRIDLNAVFNHQVQADNGNRHRLEGGSVTAYLQIVAKRLSLSPDMVSGILTAADMNNAAIAVQAFRDVEVVAVVTAGVEVNGGRAGDPASYYQEDETTTHIGTINTILIISASLPPETMARAIMTAAEAKAVALQQLMVPSHYSHGIATGSGTDDIVILSDTTHPTVLTDAGKHAKLGELIARATIEATTKALYLQSDISPVTQCDMMRRLERFGIDEQRYWSVATTLSGANKRDLFIRRLREMSKDPRLVSVCCAVLHLADEVSWGVIPLVSAQKSAFFFMKDLSDLIGADNALPMDILYHEREPIIDNWIRVSAWVFKNGWITG